MQRASTYTREMYAITQAVQKWRQYLLGRHFIIRTDHRSLKNLMSQVIQTPEQHTFLSKLLGFDYEIVYKTGKENTVADALSRRDDKGQEEECEQFMALSLPIAEGMTERVRGVTTTDVKMAELVKDWEEGNLDRQLYKYNNGILYFRNRVYIGDDKDLKRLIMKETHETLTGGHAGVIRTYMRISANFFWPGLKKDVQEFVALCVTCQTVKYSTAKPGGLLQPLPVPERVWEDISMDFITSLPPAKGLSVIFVVVDRLTKFIHLAALPAAYTAPQVAKVFVNTVVKLHGFPRSIVSDRDKVFVSKF